ncbi:hypothetical protein [Planktomarina sp.]|uniref:hypothetical protein n=1 Tax=Planktomarina sp. TaxID=2024851 RepID=UPI00289185DC|nr:hypothetical protein [Planktomarina sp.]
MKLQNDMQAALAELGKVAKRIDPLRVETAYQMIVEAERMQGDMAASPLKSADLFIVLAGPDLFQR